MILLLDNYDSFTYNLAQYLGELGADLVVRRNNEVSVDEVASLAPERIVISPGPGRPENAGITVDLIQRLGREIPMLGVCLGHQAMGYALGGRIVRAPHLMHGKTSTIDHDGKGVFRGINGSFKAGRYHSLIVADEGWPAELQVAARSTEDGVVMALRHASWPMHGVQFHPESVLTGQGKQILRNFVEL